MLQTPDEIYDDLIKEFMSQRNAIKEMINDLEQIKSKIDTLFPQQLDKRYMRFFEEKIKSVTELFKVILDMRKEIIKNTKDEFELRRKINSLDDPSDIDGIFDIKKIAERVEMLRKEKKKLEQNNKTSVLTEVKTIENMEIKK
jgi:hypothetical protein